MNVGRGGKQRIMRDTVWGDQVQRLVDDEDEKLSCKKEV